MAAAPSAGKRATQGGRAAPAAAGTQPTPSQVPTSTAWPHLIGAWTCLLELATFAWLQDAGMTQKRLKRCSQAVDCMLL